MPSSVPASSWWLRKNIERIYKQNCQNLGVLTTTDFGVELTRSAAGEEIPLSKFTDGEDDITRQVIEYGGLFPFNVARHAKIKFFLPPIQNRQAPHEHLREDFRPSHAQ